MNTQSNTMKRVFPIKFDRLHAGSDYMIFAEPTRDIRKSDDKTIYTKATDGYYSVSKSDPSKSIVLYPDDLVIPLTRGNAN